MGKLPVSLDKTIQRLGPILNDFQTTVQVKQMVIPSKRIHVLKLWWIDMDPRTKAAGDGLDGSQRIVDFMANDADEALPGIPLLLPQGDTYV